MSYSSKNYKTNNGDKLVIGGELAIQEGGIVTKNGEKIEFGKGQDGADGVSVVGATSDGTNITFELSDGSTFDVPWPDQA